MKLVKKIWKYLHVKRKQMYMKKYAVEALEKLYEISSKRNVPIWLEFGTLLGAVREKGFIPHDDDIDLGMFAENFNYQIERDLYDADFTILRLFNLRYASRPNEKSLSEIALCYKGLQIDIFFFEKCGNNRTCHSFIPSGFNKWAAYEIRFPFDKFKKIGFLGTEFLVPDKAEECLRCYYGDDFMIPDPNYKGTDKLKPHSLNYCYAEMIGGWSH